MPSPKLINIVVSKLKLAHFGIFVHYKQIRLFVDDEEVCEWMGSELLFAYSNICSK